MYLRIIHITLHLPGFGGKYFLQVVRSLDNGDKIQL